LIDHGAEVDTADKVRIDDWMRLDEEMRNVGVLRWLISLPQPFISTSILLYSNI